MRIGRKALGILVLVVLMTVIIIALKLNTRLTSSENNEVELIVVMYHAILKDENRKGEYVISPEQLEEDIKYIEQNSIKSVSVSELNDYINGKTSLSGKCILFSFDDGYYNNYYYAYPLLLKYNIKAVISPIGINSEEETSEQKQVPAYSHINFTQIREMLDSGLVEIGNHTYDMHNYSKYFGVRCPDNTSWDEFAPTLSGDLTKFQELIKTNCDYESYIFAYPFGRYDENSRKLVNSLGFVCTLSSEEGVNRIYEGGNLEMLKRYNRSGNMTSSEFFGKILKDSE